MVTLDFHQKLARQLELYLLQQAGFVLPTAGYNLIALLPVGPDSYDDKRTLLVSAESLDEVPLRDATHGLLTTLRHGLSEEEYTSLFNVDIIESSAAVVLKLSSKQLNTNYVDGEFDVPIRLIGGVTNQSITVIRSNVLSSLELGKPLVAELFDGTIAAGEIVQVENGGVLHMRGSNGARSFPFKEIRILR